MKKLREKNRSPLKWLITILVVGLSAAGSVLFFNTTELERLAADYFHPYDHVITFNGSSKNQDRIAKAFEAYEKKDYDQAEVYFTDLINTTNENYALFYLANTKLAIQKPNEAASLLQNYLSTGENLSSQAQWFLAIAYLQMNQKEMALDVLHRIVTFEGYNASKALKILEKLK